MLWCCHMLTDKGNEHRTDRKMQEKCIRCSSGDESRFRGDEGLCGTWKERIKRICNGHVADKERSTNELCRMSNGCITNKTNMFRICNRRSLNDHRTHLTSQVTDSIAFLSWVKNLVHNFMMPPKGKSAKTLQRAGEDSVSSGGWGRVLLYLHI